MRQLQNSKPVTFRRPVRALRSFTLCALLASGCTQDWKADDQSDSAATQTDASPVEVGDGAVASDAARADAALGSDADAGEPAFDASRAPDAHSADASAPEPSHDAPSDAQTNAAQNTDAQTNAAQNADAQSDVGPSADAQVSVPSEAGSVDAARFCPQAGAAFCNDFEDGPSALDSFSWNELSTTSQASLRVVDEGLAPSKRALKSALTGAVDESARIAFGLLPAAASWFHASFDFRAQLSLPVGSDNLVFWFKLTEQSGDAYPGIALASRADGTFLIVQNFDGTTESFDMYSGLELPGGWVHVDIEITNGANGSAVVRFNDKVAISYAGLLRVTNVTQTFALLGIYTQQAPASSALYDNVRFDIKP